MRHGAGGGDGGACRSCAPRVETAAETVPDNAAMKVAPGNVAALTGALRRVLEDAALHTAADASWAAGQDVAGLAGYGGHHCRRHQETSR